MNPERRKAWWTMLIGLAMIAGSFASCASLTGTASAEVLGLLGLLCPVGGAVMIVGFGSLLSSPRYPP